MDQKSTTFDNDFYVVVGVINVVQKMRTQVTNTISLYKLINAHLLLIYFKLVMKSMKLCQFQNLFSLFKKYFWKGKKLKLT